MCTGVQSAKQVIIFIISNPSESKTQPEGDERIVWHIHD